MTELKITFNQCPVDDDRFILKCELKGSSFEATDPEEMMRACVGTALRKAIRVWCDEMVKRGLASHSVEFDIDNDKDDGENPWDTFNNQPNRRK